MNVEKIKGQALKEIQEEDFRKEVDKYKQRLKERKTLWDVLCPYKILIVKKEV